MQLTPRLYRDPQDVQAMQRILVLGRQANCGTYYVHVGDINWWLYYTFPDETLWQHIRIWEDAAGQMMGWSLFSPNENAFDIFLHPHLLDTPAYAEAFTWTAQELEKLVRQAGETYVQKYWNFDNDARNARLLESLGFAPYKQDVHMVYAMPGELVAPQLPDGFSARLCRGEPDLEPRALAQYAAFESEAPWDEYLDRFRTFMRSPAYAMARDWIIEAPDGRIAAFAITWHDPVNAVGTFEPVGTNPAFQKMGLGKAIMAIGLQDMQRHALHMGQVVTSALHTPAVRLYQSAGFTCDHYFNVYKKVLPE